MLSKYRPYTSSQRERAVVSISVRRQTRRLGSSTPGYTGRAESGRGLLARLRERADSDDEQAWKLAVLSFGWEPQPWSCRVGCSPIGYLSVNAVSDRASMSDHQSLRSMGTLKRRLQLSNALLVARSVTRTVGIGGSVLIEGRRFQVLCTV